MSNRAFGIEIECYAPDHISTDEYDDGMVVEDCDCSYCESNRNSSSNENDVYSLLRNAGFSSWANLTTGDSSLTSSYSGIEIKSPILQGEDGFSELKKVFDLLNAERFWIDSTCGMHIHHDAPEYRENFDMTMRLVQSWFENQELIHNMVADYRLENDYCPPWLDGDIDWINTEKSFDSCDRNSLNVTSLHHHGTIEIRLHEGTMDYEEAESWIKFGQSFIDSVSGRKKPLKPLTNEELLLRRIKVEKNASRFLTTKAQRNKRDRFIHG
jgi:hypothetical protein